MAKQKQPKREHLYDQVVNRVTMLIRKGSLKSGDKIPSVRGMSEQMSVAISTVLHAYPILEDRGLIEPRPQSGYFVKPPHTRRVTDTVAPPEPEMRTLALRPADLELKTSSFRRLIRSISLALSLGDERRAVPLKGCGKTNLHFSAVWIGTSGRFFVRSEADEASFNA